MHRAQGSIEYLLILGGAILVAVTLMYSLTQVATETSDTANLQIYEGICRTVSIDNCGNTNSTECTTGISFEVEGGIVCCTPGTVLCQLGTFIETGATASCTDGEQNQDETDVDCGGALCDDCVDGKLCEMTDDCVSNYCNPDGVCSTPRCDDGFLNQNETDIDCGGVCGNNCNLGDDCDSDADCASTFCNLSMTSPVCATPSCFDGVQNQDETSPDCGGVCGNCNNDSCTIDTQCQSGFCNSGNVCAAPTCNDNEQNQSETGIDCGGTCLACDGESCTSNPQCQSRYCTPGGTCAVPSCSDLIKNQDETDVDCGGSTCDACAQSDTCSIDSDCQTGYCDPVYLICSYECGNNLKEGSEACDGTDTGGQTCTTQGYIGGTLGCNSTCTGFDISACTSPVCGDGLLQTTSGEVCDDGDTQNGDGCSSSCQIETGFECTGQPSVCHRSCGDATLDLGEQCDDGNASSGDGCSATCTVESGYTCTGEPSSCTRLCGNGTINPGEFCDDGDTQNGDGCSNSCQVESGYSCTMPTSGPSVCTLLPVCGNSLIETGEQCDDGDASSGDGCSNSCQIESGYACTGQPSVCIRLPVCGNGAIESGETCDDGDFFGGDGCSATCQVETGWTCTGEPSACIILPFCGDGSLDFGEQCDDGGILDGDGCSSLCQIVSPFSCNIAPRVSRGILQVPSIGTEIINEASGIVESQKNPNVIWVHNDSGVGSANNYVYAYSNTGIFLGRYRFVTSAIDVEDMELGPGPDPTKWYLYLADIGDNESLRSSTTVYRFEEPTVSVTQTPVEVDLRSQVSPIRLAYPTGITAPTHKDTETLLLDPLNADLYIVTKRTVLGQIYRASYPQSTTAINTLQHIGALPWGCLTVGCPMGGATGGNFSKDGSYIVIRRYTTQTPVVSVWYRYPTQTISQAMLFPRCDFQIASEPQGEAIAWNNSNTGFYTISEQTNPPLWYHAVIPS